MSFGFLPWKTAPRGCAHSLKTSASDSSSAPSTSLNNSTAWRSFRASTSTPLRHPVQPPDNVSAVRPRSGRLLHHPLCDGGDVLQRLLVRHLTVGQDGDSRDLSDLAKGAAAGLGISLAHPRPTPERPLGSPLAPNRLRRLVLAQTLVAGLAHPAARRPFGDIGLGHQMRLGEVKPVAARGGRLRLPYEG